MIMKYPNLSYNHYFPFYTRHVSGEKKYYYSIEIVIHISDDMGILIRLGYNQKKINKLVIERVSENKTLLEYRMSGNYLSYIDFAKEVKKIYQELSKAVSILSSEPAYYKTLIFSSFFKYNNFIELELEYRKIQVLYSNFNYKIENGKKIKPIKLEDSNSTEEDILMKKLNDAVDAIDNHTTFRNIEKKDFEKRLNEIWEYFTEYFSAPKFIRKSQYLPK